jgi:predicted RNA-binding protein with PIN domain
MEWRVTKAYIIVDGYNIINKCAVLIKAKRKSIEYARGELFSIVQAYCDYTAREGVIVYDGSQKVRSTEKGNPMVMFSNKGESADTVIESLVYNLDDKSKAAVVTDDRAMSNLLFGMGASVISVKMFEAELKSASSGLRDIIEERGSGVTRGFKFGNCK